MHNILTSPNLCIPSVLLSQCELKAPVIGYPVSWLEAAKTCLLPVRVVAGTLHRGVLKCKAETENDMDLIHVCLPWDTGAKKAKLMKQVFTSEWS